MRRHRVQKHLRVQVLARDHYRCLTCGANGANATLQVDHIVPISDGGTDELYNLATLCRDCNVGKAAHRFRNYREMRDAVSPPTATGRTPMQRWEATVGKPIRIEPLVGHPAWPEPDPWFVVRNVTDCDVRLFKRSCHQDVTLPLSSLGAPWGGGDRLRANIERGSLIFVPERREWEWRPVR